MKYFITGIGTGVGKTVVSAILVEALQADYWKPVQCGLPRDTEEVLSLIRNPLSEVFPEQYLLKEPASPHQAAANEGVVINLDQITPPHSERDLIIEGAGGVMVPLNDKEFMLDLIKKLSDQVILVASLYLGSINHTLLTIDVLKHHRINITGIIFNGPLNPYSESLILSYSGIKQLLHLQPNSTIDSKNINKWAQKLKPNLY